MFFIFGLGNPGLKYKKTRHNAGFCVIDELADRHGIRLKSTKMEALLGQGMIGGQKAMLVKPVTYMNNSGYAVSAVLDYYDAEASQMMVVYDDIDLPFGTLRIRERGSAGTHNGMRSIISYLKTEDFLRLRVGIGKPNISLTGHVLGKFPKEKREEAREMFSRAADACECILAKGVQAAQELYQRPSERE
ncbi:MAG: aminoacyl-tRNA hydrolase [Christensenellaceae bacterium]|jgi:PTH1 family peptidyl-tRNA hydrolase